MKTESPISAPISAPSSAPASVPVPETEITSHQADLKKVIAKKPVLKNTTAKKPVIKETAAKKTTAKKVVAKKPILKKIAPKAKEATVEEKSVNPDLVVGLDEVIAFNQNNIDAITKSNTLFAEGMQVFGQDVFGYVQGLLSSHGTVMQEMFQSQDPSQALEIQQAYVKGLCEDAVKETQNFSERAANFVETVSTPISGRVSEVAVSVTKKIAA